MRNFVFLFLLFNLACKGQKSIVALEEKQLELVLKDNYSGIKTPENVVIKDKVGNGPSRLL